MMTRKLSKPLVTVWLLFITLAGWTQEKPQVWNLSSCIKYAREQNIQVRKSKIALKENVENVKEAQAQSLPSLAFSSSQGVSNRPGASGTKTSYTGSYDLNSSVSLYQGGKLRSNVQQKKIQQQVSELAVNEAENNIEIAVTESFMQLQYAYETVKINTNTLAVSEKQWERGKQLLAEGALSKAGCAQLEAQYTSDRYQLVVARTSLENARLDLKQLLELDMNENMEFELPQYTDKDILKLLPSKEDVWFAAQEIMPEVKYSLLNIEVANLEKQKARSALLPDLRLSAGVGTSHLSGSSWSRQLGKNWSESLGLMLNIPIYSNRSAKTTLNLAQLNIENTSLEYENVRKTLLKSVETVYQDAISAQERFRAAGEKLKASELSFELTQEQFFLGMKNTVEMLTEKNNLFAAQQECVQAKYMAILNRQLLDIYQHGGMNTLGE